MRRFAHLPLFTILLIYLIAGSIYAVCAPFLDVSDEVRHYAMVEHLAQGRGLPVQDVALNQRIVDEERQAKRSLTYYAQEGSQPPLYYALMALVALPFDRSDHAELVWPNPHAKLGRADATNNWNQLIHTPAEAFPWHGTVLVVMLMRFIGVLLGAVTVACTYFIALEMKDERSTMTNAHLSSFIFHLVPALAAALVAFNPMFVHIMASVNNDTLATALSTLVLLIGARMIRRGSTVRSALLLGVVLGCAALSKASGLALAIVVPFFVLVAEVTRRYSDKEKIAPSPAKRHLFTLSIALLLPAWLIAGWWYARNQLLYGDFTGTTMMARIAGARDALPPALELIGEWDGFFKSYWGLFGAVNIPMDLWIYTTLQVPLILAGFGLLLVIGDWLRAVRRADSPFSIFNFQFSILLLLFSAFLVTFAALARWTSLTLASQGRLLFPVIAPISIFTALGLARVAYSVSCTRLLRNTHYALRFIPVALAALTLLAPFIYIRPAYQTPQRLPGGTQLQLDRQTELLFEDKIRYIGFRVNTPKQRVQPGDVLDVTLYWQALKPLDKNYSAFIKLFGKDNRPVHELNTYPGGGMWQTKLWQPNEIIADRYRLRIDNTLTNTQLAPTALQLDVGFWDFVTKQDLQTFDGSGEKTGRQRYEAASLNTPRPAPNFSIKSRFEKASLTGVRAERTGQEVTLALDWLATDDFTEDYTTFVQLFDYAGKKMDPQDDRRAKNGDFAPRWWRKGDLILNDTYIIELPPDFPPGQYTIKFGLYTKDDVRMPAFDDNEQPISDSALSVPIEIR